MCEWPIEDQLQKNVYAGEKIVNTMSVDMVHMWEKRLSIQWMWTRWFQLTSLSMGNVSYIFRVPLPLETGQRAHVFVSKVL